MNKSLSDTFRTFASLPDFHLAKHALIEHKNFLNELGLIICRYDLQEYVGITLLHKHFHIHSNEYLVKSFAHNKASIKPYIQQDNDNIVPYLWKCIEHQVTGMNSYCPLEFITITGQTQKASIGAEKLAHAEDFLTEMAFTLHRLKAENTFGISTLHTANEITLNDDEILLETTDHKHRTLTLSPTPKARLDLSEVTETLWQFTAVTEGEVVTECKHSCQQHCDNHSDGE